MKEPLYRLAANVVAEATDPRAANARAFALDAAGKIVGVRLEWIPRPETPWELVQAVLIDEYQATGNTVATYSAIDERGIETPVNCWLTWPYPDLTKRLLPGNPNRQHTITSTYPTDGRIGPLGLYIGDGAGAVQSDIIWGLGLPDNRHVCFFLTWRKRGSVVVTPPDDGETPVGDDGASLTVLREIRDAVKAGFRL